MSESPAHQEVFPLEKREIFNGENWNALRNGSERLRLKMRRLSVNQQSLELLARHAFHDISHYLRSSHLGQLRKSLMIQMLLQMIALSLLIC